MRVDPGGADLGRSPLNRTRNRLGNFAGRVIEFPPRRPNAAALVVYMIVICGIYWSVLDGSRSLITNGPWSRPLFVIDPAAGGLITAPMTRLAAASWIHLHLPIVDPFQAYGVPLLANQGVPVYPPQVLAHLLFPGNYSVWLVANLVALAFGVYLLARSFGQSFFGALAAGFLASLAGVAPPNVNTSMLNPLAVLPFVLLAVRHALDPASEHRRAAMLGLATSVAFLCLSGFQEVLPLMAIVIVVYTAALVVHLGTWRARPLLIAWSAVAGTAGVLIGSVGILPTLFAVGTGVNTAGLYTSHFPDFWLSTLTLPTITGHAVNAGPLNLGPPMNVLGTPLLVVVVVLASIIACRRLGAGTRWYVLPSVIFVVFGVLAYADVGHVLQLMDVPLFDRIDSNRFLQFAWWIPLCLLLGTVLSNVRMLKWRDALLALLGAAAFDEYFFVRFRQALAAKHIASGPPVSHAPLIAAAVVVAFLVAALSARWVGLRAAGLLMAAVVLGSTIYDLPTNFAPAPDGHAVATVRLPSGGGSPRAQLVLFGDAIRQLPTEQYSIQLYGPIVPRAYRALLGGLFSLTETGGLGPLYPAAPTLFRLDWTPRSFSVLRSLGVNVLVLPAPLPTFRGVSMPACRMPGARSAICYLGKVPDPVRVVGNAPSTEYVYRISGADPLVQPTATPIAVPSNVVANRRFARSLSIAEATIPSRAYVVASERSLRPARGVRGVSRQATSEQVSVVLQCRAAGIAVLRESYEQGMHALVDGQRTTALPVDGGLWTAVEIPSGRSRVVLDYVTTADLMEFLLEAAGLTVLIVMWAAVAVSTRQKRRGHKAA